MHVSGGFMEANAEIVTSSSKLFHRGAGATSVGRGVSKILVGQSKAGMGPILTNVGITLSGRVKKQEKGEAGWFSKLGSFKRHSTSDLVHR